MSNGDKEIKEKILKLVQDSLQLDTELREQFQIGNKFRFIRDRLDALKLHVEEELSAIQQEIEKKSGQLTDDEVIVYVYIFNAQGLVFQTWQKMLNPSVFYEYSVNRPIYAEKSHIESFIRSRPTKPQHGYLTMIVKKTDILPQPVDAAPPKDQVGNPLIKIREGSLNIRKMIAFVHLDHEYVVDEEGHVVKKNGAK